MVLGVLGIVLPILPTTPFLLLAAVCYARSSPRLLYWLNHNRWFGAYIRRYREGLGIPLREKLLTIAMLWLTISVSVVFFVSIWWAKALLVAIALAVTTHLLRVRTYSSNADRIADGGPLEPAINSNRVESMNPTD